MNWACLTYILLLLAVNGHTSTATTPPVQASLPPEQAVAFLDRGQLIVRSWLLGEALCGDQLSPLSLAWGPPCYMVDVTLALTPQQQENDTILYNAYIQTTQSGWDQWMQASDAGTSWRLQALAYVWTISAVVTAVVWLLFVVYSSITWPPSFFQFTQTTLVVMAAIFYLVLFLYDEATDWVFIWGVTNTGSILAVTVLCWIKFGRSFLGMALLLFVSLRMRGARLPMLLLFGLYIIWLAFLIVMTVEITKVGIETYTFCRDDAIFIFGFSASLSLLFSLMLAAILLYQSVTIAIGTRRRRTAFIALQLFMAVLQFGPMAFLQSLLWWQGWGLVSTTIMLLSVTSSVVGLTGTLLSLLLVVAKACCFRGVAPVTWHKQGEGDEKGAGGHSLEHGGSKVAPEPPERVGSVTDSAMRAIERSKSSFGYDPQDPRAMLTAPPQQAMTELEVVRMQALLGEAAASSPPAPWQKPMPWQPQQQQRHSNDGSGQELSLASAQQSSADEHSLQQHSPAHSHERSSPVSGSPQRLLDDHSWQYRKPGSRDDPRRQYKALQRPEYYSSQRHGAAAQQRRYGDWQQVDSLMPYGVPSLRAPLPPHAGNVRPLPRYDQLLSRTVINAYTQGYQEGLEATIQQRIKPPPRQ